LVYFMFFGIFFTVLVYCVEKNLAIQGLTSHKPPEAGS
jgi:hypothetical protein